MRWPAWSTATIFSNRGSPVSPSIRPSRSTVTCECSHRGSGKMKRDPLAI